MNNILFDGVMGELALAQKPTKNDLEMIAKDISFIAGIIQALMFQCSIINSPNFKKEIFEKDLEKMAEIENRYKDVGK